MNRILVLFLLLLQLEHPTFGQAQLILTDDLNEVCLSRSLVKYFEDTTAKLKISEIEARDGKTILFKNSEADDLINQNLKSAYWLKYSILNKSDKPFRIEVFDFDIDQISFFKKNEEGVYVESKAGYAEYFDKRQIEHKNVSFNLLIPKNEEAIIYMRFFSIRQNVLEPIARSYDRIIEYGLSEYMLFGLFYGLMLLMIFYNLLYFILLRKSYYLNYVLFASGILLYLMAENGTGFQYLWRSFPEFNPLAASIGLFIGISALLFFVISFLDMELQDRRMKEFLVCAFVLRIAIFAYQIHHSNDFKWELIDLIYIQIALIAGIMRYKKSPDTAKWYIIAFVLLDISFLISGMEHLGCFPSSIYSVYSLNIGIILQFVFLSIGIGERVQETYRLKNEAQAELILEYKKTDELKERINRDLEEKVKDRTQKLRDQFIEIQMQQEEIKL